MVKLTKKEETPFLAAPFHPAHLFVLHRGAAVQFAAKSSLDRLRRRMKAAGTGVEGGSQAATPAIILSPASSFAPVMSTSFWPHIF